MSSDYRPPDWLDPETMEWCAQALGGVAVRLLQHWPDAVERRIGVEAGAGTIRAYLQLVRDQQQQPPPAPRPQLKVVR